MESFNYPPESLAAGYNRSVRAALLVLALGACAESRPGLYARGASSRWFTKESQIEGEIRTNRGKGLSVRVVVTGDGDRAHVDVADGSYIVRDLPRGKYTVHYLLPG